MTETADIPLERQVFLLDSNLTGWFDLMYSLLDLKAGTSVQIPALFPDDLELRSLDIAVRPDMEDTEWEGQARRAFVCDLTVSGKEEVHYVLDDGTLLKIMRPQQSVVIERVSESLLE